MFTGIVERVGKVKSVSQTGSTAVIRIISRDLDLSDVAVGDSIAVNGVCLTVKEIGADFMDFDVSAETLNVTTGFRADDRVNLEKSLRLDGRIGGHLVSGHVDAVGEVDKIVEHDGNSVMTVRFPRSLARFLVRKGSVAINGVSLTVNSVDDDWFAVNIIPHTRVVTNLGGLSKGDHVNLEI
ncbi:MAG: riboflavin synthase, partial [Burkholderiales bacterium]|nr:riboflavin synthase [Burkholderiales bacterium]